jgi:hypothetical protein
MPRIGYRHTAETKEKMSATRRAKPAEELTRLSLIANAARQKLSSEEQSRRGLLAAVERKSWSLEKRAAVVAKASQTRKARKYPAWNKLDRKVARCGHEGTFSVNHPDCNICRRAKEHGITYEDYMAMLTAQGSVCAICHKPERVIGRHGAIKAMAIDHDHDTGKVRGLLCQCCNQAIGLLDSIKSLEAAIKYLNKRSIIHLVKATGNE